MTVPENERFMKEKVKRVWYWDESEISKEKSGEEKSKDGLQVAQPILSNSFLLSYYYQGNERHM